MKLTRKQYRELYKLLHDELCLPDIWMFCYDYYPQTYDRLPYVRQVDKLLWFLIDEAKVATDFTLLLELLKDHNRMAYEEFMDPAEGTTSPSEPPVEDPPAQPDGPLTFGEKQALIQALLACSAIKERGRRNTVLGSLPAGLQQTLTRSDVALDDVTNLVNACENYPDGWQHLLEVLEFFEQGSLPFQRVQALLDAG